MHKLIFKFIFFITLFFYFQGKIFACEFTDTEADFEVVTNSRNNIREVPCIGTKTFGTTKIGETFKVIADSGDYYKVLINGQPRYIFKDGTDLKTENNTQIEVKEEVKIENLESEISKYWLSLYNVERAKLGLKPYAYDERLQNSANTWAKISGERGYYSHKRAKGDVYYDFWKIQNWFKQNGVDCKIENRTGAVENIGFGVLQCKSGDCLEETKKTVKKTFDMYMREKGKKNSSHYDAIVSKNLNYLGFGIYKKPIGKNSYGLYNVTHFCTNFN
ncbi:CAP domain-containing protein [Candidatus Gracilibacteria bacterium]|nr:MAG: CAP domain-containing protein [Candidatus Gracilibacteria bacterium]